MQTLPCTQEQRISEAFCRVLAEIRNAVAIQEAAAAIQFTLAAHWQLVPELAVGMVVIAALLPRSFAAQLAKKEHALRIIPFAVALNAAAQTLDALLLATAFLMMLLYREEVILRRQKEFIR